MADYNEKVVSLAVALNRAEIVGPGVPIDSLYINGEVPVGVVVKIHGGSRVGLVVKSNTSIELCPPEKEGIYVSSVGVAAVDLSIVVGTGVYRQGG